MTTTAVANTEGLRRDLTRRLQLTYDHIDHLEGLIARHRDFGDARSAERLENLKRDLRNAQIDAGRLEGELAELDTEAAE